MLTLSIFHDSPQHVVAGLRKKGFPNAQETVDQVLLIDQKRKELQQSLNKLQEELNKLSGEIGLLMKSGQKEAAEVNRAQVQALKEDVKAGEVQLKELENTLEALLLSIPNLPSEFVPVGLTPDDNEIILSFGAIPSLPEGALPHWDLISKYDIVDFEAGNKVTGAGFPFYKGKGARLQRSMINFFLDEAVKAGYTEMQPPILINEASGYGTGQLPDKDGQMYLATEDNLFLIPTAEVPITNYYRDSILKDSELPVRNVGYTPCFRREAGSWGSHVRGLNRLHQFDKVEIVQIIQPEKSYEALEDMSLHVQGLLKKLELPYRVLRLCGGDMSFTSALTYDMEVYSAAQQRWLEVSSVSNFESFQANRLKLRYKAEGDKKTTLLHTLNGSALALPRILAAILENNQTPEGIQIPKVLVPYCGFEWIS